MIVLQLVKTSIGGNWALRQMIELVKLGVEVHVAMPTDGPLVDQYLKGGIKVHALDYKIQKIWKSVKGLRQIVNEVSPDIIHSNFVITTIIMRLALRNSKIPRCFQVPGPLHLESWVFRTIDILLAQKNDYWIGSCKWTNDRYRRSGINDDRIFLSYYGSDLQKNNNYQKGKLKSTLGLGESDILIGIVAYMYAPKRYLGQKRGLKGHEDLIDAVKILSEKYPNLYCVCIGGAWGGAVEYEKFVMKYAIENVPGRIFFTGTIQDVSVVYNDLFCVVHPSHSENLGGAGESLLLGVPTITTNVGGFPDIVIDGKTGLTVPPKSPHAIAKAVDDLLSGKYDLTHMKQNGQILTREMLDITNTAESMFKIYMKILHV